VTRFTVLPFITGLAERRQALRGTLIVAAFATALGLALVGTQHLPLAVFLIYVVTSGLWTSMTPLTDAYALRGVARYGLNYGPLRLWGSAAFVAGALACGLLVDLIAAEQLIWVIASVAALGAVVSLGLQPLDSPRTAAAPTQGTTALLRDPGFLAIIAASALIQGSHAAYYVFASISWQQSGFGGLTIAGLWSLGVLAEIVLFALSPRLPAALAPTALLAIGAAGAIVRWTAMAFDPATAALPALQALHAASFGAAHLGAIGFLARAVPKDLAATAQGYVATASVIVMASATGLAGLLYAQAGSLAYLMMSAMALAGLGCALMAHRMAR
jgi:PPP family 3-phenylpropionic acid transporter